MCCVVKCAGLCLGRPSFASQNTGQRANTIQSRNATQTPRLVPSLLRPALTSSHTQTGRMDGGDTLIRSEDDAMSQERRGECMHARTPVYMNECMHVCMKENRNIKRTLVVEARQYFGHGFAASFLVHGTNAQSNVIVVVVVAMWIGVVVVVVGTVGCGGGGLGRFGRLLLLLVDRETGGLPQLIQRRRRFGQWRCR